MDMCTFHKPCALWEFPWLLTSSCSSLPLQPTRQIGSHPLSFGPHATLYSAVDSELEQKTRGVCLFCRKTAFPSDEVYLLSDRASECCWCRGVSPPWWPHFHTPTSLDYANASTNTQCSRGHGASPCHSFVSQPENPGIPPSVFAMHPWPSVFRDGFHVGIQRMHHRGFRE